MFASEAAKQLGAARYELMSSAPPGPKRSGFVAFYGRDGALIEQRRGVELISKKTGQPYLRVVSASASARREALVRETVDAIMAKPRRAPLGLDDVY